MKSLANFILTFLITVVSAAASGTSAPPPYACAFLNITQFGSSITAGYGGTHDGAVAKLKANLREPSLHFGTRSNPIEHTQKELFGALETENLAEMVGDLRFRSNGPRQLKAYLASPRGYAKFADSSMVASIDAFYWASAEGNCDETVAAVTEITSTVASQGKALVLATVPLENPEFVHPILKASGWKRPRPSCIARVNAKLRETCKAESQCYLIDLNGLVGQLNTRGIVLEGRRVYSQDIRFDGVHLTELGKRHVAEMITGQMSKNPPKCADDPLKRREVADRIRESGPPPYPDDAPVATRAAR